MQSSDKEYHTHTLPNQNFKLPILTKLYEFYQVLAQTINTFPKSFRYSIGLKLDNLTLEIIESILELPFSDNKLQILQKISIKFDTLKILVRLSKDYRAIADKKYFQLELILSEIGKMLGGWIKSTNEKRVYNRNSG